MSERGGGAAESPVSAWPRLAADHARATRLAGLLASVPGITPQARVDSNIIYFALDSAWAAANWEARVAAARGEGKEAVVVSVGEGAGGATVAIPLSAVPPSADMALAFKSLVYAATGAKCGTYGTTKVRAVTHHQVSDAGVDALVAGARAAGRLLAPL